ncbi:tetratricopeptide repeat-containing glycosyltransferase family 2 protein [Alicyclobacillus cycloheptanicus]|uniref:Glycosyltransferase involved in cell wall biosynthesis n=1 Tax=Alicyclobacillus cycloheptanicus TaxID=1457 RepID=A0ABT9XKU1_9BACL|nr:glycosyltransferase family 2 protein [Alicyclobacillus cycloheptanicus]MDQ0190669.1 glycosyltransferase involved in cell wall biosynthesis [Alicyclobacillus cycloheptanicus]
MLLSACMIVKNEEATLERCLASLSGVADEIIVVDTGSTDRTVEIAEAHGARVFPFAWDNNFAHARNESLRHANGEWILVIDADEYLDEQKKLGLRAFLQETSAEGVLVTQKNYMGSLQNITKIMPIRVMRLFRRGHYYSGSIHEQIAYSVEKTGKPITSFDLDLHHVGYTEEFVRKRAKSERNTILLEKELSQDPENLFHRSNLMAEYIITRQFQQAAELGDTTFRMLKRTPVQNWPNFAARIHLHWIGALWEINEKERALQHAAEGIEYFPWFTDLKRHYATMLMQQGDWQGAERVLMACRKQGDTKQGLIEFTEGMGTYFAAMDLGTVWSWLGDDIVARKWYLQAFLENPTLSSCVVQLVYLLPPVGDFLKEHIESRIVDGMTYGMYAETYAIRGIAGADGVIERAKAAFGASEMTQRAEMATLVQEGIDRMEAHVHESPHEFNWYLLGLRQLELGDEQAALASLAKGGVRGEYIVKTHRLLTTSDDARWGIQFVARDLAAMRCTNLLRKWLPFATGLHDVWLYLKHSPVGQVLEEVDWPGGTVYECEQNALRCFKQKDFAGASHWVAKAKQFSQTVTQVLLSCDVALANHDIQGARHVVYEGKKRFPESEAIKNASAVVHPQVNPVDLLNQMSNAQAAGGALH